MTKFFNLGPREHQIFDVIIVLIINNNKKIEHGKMPRSRKSGDSLPPPWVPLSRDSPRLPLNASGTLDSIWPVYL